MTKEAAVSITIEFPWRERALSMIAEAGLEIPGEEMQDRDAAVNAYWGAVEGRYHFEEPAILCHCLPYDFSAEDEAARLAAVLILRERVERLRWAVESDGDA